jgi:hypothetical protein
VTLTPATSRESSGAPAPFGDPPVAPVNWYDGDDEATLTLVDALISGWTSKGSGAANAVQATLGSRPMSLRGLSTALLAGRAAQLNSGRFMTTAAPMDDNSCTLFMAGLWLGGNGATGTLLGSSANSGIELQAQGDGSVQVIKQNVAIAATSGAFMTQGRSFVYGCAISPTNIVHWRNGTDEVDSNAQVFSGGGLMWIGAGGNGGRWGGVLAEVLTYDTTLDLADRALVGEYLMDKWGVA